MNSLSLMLNDTYYVCFLFDTLLWVLEKMFHLILYELLLIGWNIINGRIGLLLYE